MYGMVMSIGEPSDIHYLVVTAPLNWFFYPKNEQVLLFCLKKSAKCLDFGIFSLQWKL
jgi:hypothetical protein